MILCYPISSYIIQKLHIAGIATFTVYIICADWKPQIKSKSQLELQITRTNHKIARKLQFHQK